LSNHSDTKLALSLKLLAHLKKEAAKAATPKTRAALANMVKVQERVVAARQQPAQR
jgi:hypothetical protein